MMLRYDSLGLPATSTMDRQPSGIANRRVAFPSRPETAALRHGGTAPAKRNDALAFTAYGLTCTFIGLATMFLALRTQDAGKGRGV